MRSSYNKSAPTSPPTELNTRPPGYKALEERVEALERLVTHQGELIAKMQPPAPEAA